MIEFISNDVLVLVVKIGLIIAGGVLIALGFAGYLYPITSIGSASDVHELCTSGFGQLGKAFSEQIRENYFVKKK